jgi:hypothetical protein
VPERHKIHILHPEQILTEVPRFTRQSHQYDVTGQARRAVHALSATIITQKGADVSRQEKRPPLLYEHAGAYTS